MNFKSLIISASFGLSALLLGSFMVFGPATVNASACTDTTTLVSNGSSGAICSSAAFTSGANSKITGNVSSKAAITLGATSRVNGSVTSGADFTSGDSSVVSGNVTAKGDITLG